MFDALESLESRLVWEALRYAVGRAIWCPYCGDLMDVRRAVLLENPAGCRVTCGRCWDAAVARLRSSGKRLPPAGAEVTDGRHFDDDGWPLPRRRDPWAGPERSTGHIRFEDGWEVYQAWWGGSPTVHVYRAPVSSPLEDEGCRGMVRQRNRGAVWAGIID